MDVTARTAVLLALDRPASGKEIVSLVSARSNGRIRLHFGSVYPTLGQLERENLVRSWTQRVGRGRPRHNYELTVAGVSEAERVRESLRSLIAPASLPSISRTPVEMAEGIRGCEEISLLARALRQAGVKG